MSYNREFKSTGSSKAKRQTRSGEASKSRGQFKSKSSTTNKSEGKSGSNHKAGKVENRHERLDKRKTYSPAGFDHSRTSFPSNPHNRPVNKREALAAPSTNYFPTGEEGQNSFEPTNDRIEGRNSVLEAFKAGRTFNKIWIVKQDSGKKDPTLHKIFLMAKDVNVAVAEVPKITLDQMSQTFQHQGVIAQVAAKDYVEIDDIIELARTKDEPPFLLILDELKDAYNLGSILRIADGAGVHGVIIPKHRSIGLDSLVAKASAGAIEHVPVARVTNLTQCILDLKEKGFWIGGTDGEASQPYYDFDYSDSLALVIGSEGDGMRQTVKEKCDFTVSIPMVGAVNSLNAAVAAGVVVFEVQKQRLKSGKIKVK